MALLTVDFLSDIYLSDPSNWYSVRTPDFQFVFTGLESCAIFYRAVIDVIFPNLFEL